MITLKSKNKLTIPRKAGVKTVHVYAEGMYKSETAHEYVFQETYYFIDQVPNGMFGESGEPEFLNKRFVLETEEQKKSMAEIDAFFTSYGTSITSETGYSAGKEANFQNIFATVVRLNENYGVAGADWIKDS